ncbi:MAG: hypothetical protein LBL90_08900 [Prevotellaceae bacterium]|jgi:hypothetical protein|nr:hypothetical protein [Prevotellaceae bacterium]
MESVFIIVLSIASALLVFGAVFFVLNRMLQHEDRKRQMELLANTRRITIPMRLQAYERLILFLERISPDTMIMRVRNDAVTNADLHLLLLKTIRSEFEHNISQQLYVGSQTWELIKLAKEGIATLINDAAKVLNPNDPSINLSKAIFDKLVELGELPTAQAIESLKKEARQIF